TNTVTVRLVDNGSPSLSVTQSFVVLVGSTNRAPVLAPVVDQTVNELTTLSVTNSANDPDGASEILTYALVTAPTGVSLNPSTGLLSWTPTEAQGPNTNVITVRVFDDGTPSLSTTQSFRVFVNEVNTAPTLAPVT